MHVDSGGHISIHRRANVEFVHNTLHPNVFSVPNDPDSHITQWFADWTAHFRPNAMHTLEQRGKNYYHIPSSEKWKAFVHHVSHIPYHLSAKPFILAALPRLRFTMYLVFFRLQCLVYVDDRINDQMQHDDWHLEDLLRSASDFEKGVREMIDEILSVEDPTRRPMTQVELRWPLCMVSP